MQGMCRSNGRHEFLWNEWNLLKLNLIIWANEYVLLKRELKLTSKRTGISRSLWWLRKYLGSQYEKMSKNIKNTLRRGQRSIILSRWKICGKCWLWQKYKYFRHFKWGNFCCKSSWAWWQSSKCKMASVSSSSYFYFCR